ncbi:hypothetical protein B0T13DRAFT_20062 [Neurospora crassa]|nr:hypothetical protein B0T13DRAFT_20062 [Neurospora crassa]
MWMCMFCCLPPLLMKPGKTSGRCPPEPLAYFSFRLVLCRRSMGLVHRRVGNMRPNTTNPSHCCQSFQFCQTPSRCLSLNDPLMILKRRKELPPTPAF